MKKFTLVYTPPTEAPSDTTPGAFNPVTVDPTTGQPFISRSFTITISDSVLSDDQTLSVTYGLKSMYDLTVDFGTFPMSMLQLDGPLVITGPVDRVQDMAEVVIGDLFNKLNMTPYLTGSTFMSVDDYIAKWSSTTIFDPTNGTAGGSGSSGSSGSSGGSSGGSAD